MPLPVNSEEIINNWFESKEILKPDDFLGKVEIYHDLILSWSGRINLVSPKDLGCLVERHILDSLTPIGAIPNHGNLLDVGSGAGFPAIPIAFLRPGLRITMLEARHKKVLFLREAVSQLNLKNTGLYEGRVEAFAPDLLFDIITIRALPARDKFLSRIEGLIRRPGLIIQYEKLGKVRLIERP